LIYLTKLNWKRYTNVEHFRSTVLFEDLLEAWYIREWYSKFILENWLWKLYNNEWKEIPIYSDEYSTATLNAINTMWDTAQAILDEADKRKELNN
jgi:hypothetical protein